MEEMISDILILSPHLDDAALSCCTRLYKNEVASVVTVFAGVSKKANAPTEWDRITKATNVAERQNARRQEDSLAWASISQANVQLDFCEGERSKSQRRKLEKAIVDAAKPYSVILVPCGIGSHPDHILVRDLAVSSLANCKKLLFYGELPYTAFYGWPNVQFDCLDVEAYWSGAISTVPNVARLVATKLRKLSDIERLWKLRLLSHYKTQIPAISGGSLCLFQQTSMLDYEVEFEVSFRNS